MVLHEYHGHTPYTIYLVIHYTQLKIDFGHTQS